VLTLPAFAWAAPATLDELLAELARAPGETLLVAGGTDAVPNLKHRLHEPKRIVHLGGVRELDFARDEADGLHLGPLVTLARLARLEPVVRDFPALALAASQVAGPQLRNMGTLGGNLCLDTRCTYYNQTLFWREALGFCLKKDGQVCHVVPAGKRCVAAHSSDVAPMLIALDAEVEIASAAGRRTIAVEAFFGGDGVHNNVLAPGEVVTRVAIPARSRGLAAGYRKLRPRGAIDFPMLSVAFAARRDPGGACVSARLIVSAIAAKPRTISGVDAVVAGRPLDATVAAELAALAYKQCRPLINVPYDAEWRQEMVPVFVKRTVLDAAGGGAAT
jgi:4-hydroxybenzoyl-CoA reductase subunit beta